MNNPGQARPMALGLGGSAALHAAAIAVLVALSRAPERPAPPVGLELLDVTIAPAPSLPAPLPAAIDPAPADPTPPEPEPTPPRPAPAPSAAREPPAPAPSTDPATAADPAPGPPPDAVERVAAVAPLPGMATTAASASLGSAVEPPPAPPPVATSKRAVATGLAALAAVPPLDAELTDLAPPGVAADLNLDLPGEPVVTVVLRLDRARDTIWADRIEALVRPLPDYRALVAPDSGSFFEHFETLVMSSPHPRDVTATLVAARIRRDPDGARAFIDRAGPVTWHDPDRRVWGERDPALLATPRDTRVFLMASDQWLLLAPRAYVDALPPPTPDGPPADTWLARLPELETAAGADTGPIAIATLTSLPAAVRLPLVGVLAAPDRATVTLTQAGHGFYLRGTLLFGSPARAEAFVAQAERARRALLDGFTRQILTGLRALNAAEGLRLRVQGAAVGFSTSFSILDARALLDLAAHAVASYYQQLEPAPRAAPGATP